MNERKRIKDWELETGITLRENRTNNKITEKQFKRRIKHEYIICKTNKGLMYLSNCQEVQMNREDLKNYKYNQIWIKRQLDKYQEQKTMVYSISQNLDGMPKAKNKPNYGLENLMDQYIRFLKSQKKTKKNKMK